ncbi:MAG: efflux RND transporter periplasmic adaptor subunit [Oscillospiraceae bacterium]|nr:efflux RND transporter periplasmic adaptor subunit [Oscillospiraceae bacterium]
MSNEKLTITETEETTEAAETATEKKKSGGKKIMGIILVLTLVVGGIIGFYFYWQGASYLTTGNASVQTNLIQIFPPAPGRLDRFTVSEGSFVSENEIIGRVENVGHLRSPVDGVVVDTNAVLNQVVSPQMPVAVIADMNNIHIRANIEEGNISQLQIGQRAYATIDALGNRQFVGYISSIGLVTDAALSGHLTSFTTGGTFTRITQLVPIKITITDEVALYNLIGLNATVRIPLR